MFLFDREIRGGIVSGQSPPARPARGTYTARRTRKPTVAERCEQHAAKMREQSKTLKKVLAMRKVWAQRKGQAG